MGFSRTRPNPIQLNNQAPEHPLSPLSAGPSTLPGSSSRCPPQPIAALPETLKSPIVPPTSRHHRLPLDREEIRHQDVPVLPLHSFVHSLPFLLSPREPVALPSASGDQPLPSPGALGPSLAITSPSPFQAFFSHWFHVSQARLHLDIKQKMTLNIPPPPPE